MKNLRLEIREVPVTEINPSPHNPRVTQKPGSPALTKTAKSIDLFGYVLPLVWNELTKHLVSGHLRFQVLVEKGVQAIEVVVVRLSLEKEKLLNLILNTHYGTWDEDRLGQTIQDLAAVPDLDISLSGFEMLDISRILDQLKPDVEDDFDVEAAVASIDEPITKPGDVIQLGRHRICCGDSADPAVLQRLMGEEKAHLLFCDPPYGVSYMGGSRPKAGTRPKDTRDWKFIYGDNLSHDEYKRVYGGIFRNVVAWLIPGAAAYIWNAHKNFAFMHQSLTELGFHVSCVLTWVKENFSIDYSDYHQASEFCLYSWFEGAPHRWFGPANETTVWQVKRDPTRSYIHPTQKPIALAQRAIRNSTLQDELVLDLFLGSGSTLIAAETLGRKCYGVELDARYVDGIAKRFIALVGKGRVSPDIRARYIKEGSHVG